MKIFCLGEYIGAKAYEVKEYFRQYIEETASEYNYRRCSMVAGDEDSLATLKGDSLVYIYLVSVQSNREVYQHYIFNMLDKIFATENGIYAINGSEYGHFPQLI